MTVILTLIKEIKQVKWLFFWAVVLFLLGTMASQLAPMMLQTAIDAHLRPLTGQTVFQASAFLQLMSGYLLLLLMGAGLTYWASRLLRRSGNQIVADLRNRAYDVMQNLPIAYFSDKPAGQLATRIVNDTETLRNDFYGILVNLLTNFLRVVLTYGIVFYLNLALGAILLLPVFYLVQLLYKKLTDQPTKDFFEARSQVNTQVNETMNGASLLQLYGQEEAVLSEFEAAAGHLLDADKRIIWGQSISSWPLTEFIRNLVVTVILTLGGYQFLSGKVAITPGRLFLYLNYMVDLFDLMGALVRQFPNIQRSIETGKRVQELLGEETEMDAAAELVMTDGRVIFDHVSFAYEEGQATLSDINLVAEKGQTIDLVGHTGSGKSSLMNFLYRFYEPIQGQILVDGQAIDQFSRESLRRYMGIVLQDPYLFTGTIASNVAMDQADVDDEAIIVALEKVGAADLLARLDKGIHEPVVEKGAAFSSGERQLIAFARTLFSNPKLLILDEATSHIDTETEEVIQLAMEVVKEGRTTFIIAHRLSTIQHADQILVLDKGRIVERGRPEDLLAQDGVYAHMYQIQQNV
ncbi:ABC transporter ATP-binding protein [Streptococcus sp. E17BB]|uniref:ABC transporter ATP-binding protein n=1 Tax=Streptococcus sp. E17BB TaxID=3278714 RepID=UPI00359D10BC